MADREVIRYLQFSAANPRAPFYQDWRVINTVTKAVEADGFETKEEADSCLLSLES